MEEPEKKLKILYLITKSNFGGAQRYVFDLATHAQKAGHTVLVGFGGNGPLEEKLREAGVRTVAIPELGRDVNIYADMKCLFRLIDLFADELPDIVHLNSSKIGALGAVAGRVWNAWSWCTALFNKGNRPARIIFTGHGWAFNEERSDLERFLIGCAHWLTIQLAHKTITVSRKTREQVSRLPFVWHKLAVINNGVGITTSLSRDNARERIFGAPGSPWTAHDPIVIGTLAELHKNKGLSYAIEGMALLKKQSATPFCFVILGDGEERPRLQALITKLELDTTVLLAGYHEHGAELLSAFDIFLLPSITEAFPYAILEAGNAGLPVIATAVGGIPEVIDDMKSGILIQSKNPGEVARALSYLFEHTDRRRELAEAIRERIRGRFNVETMVNETLSLYATH